MYTHILAVLACVAMVNGQAPIPDKFSQIGWKLGNQSKPEGEGATIEIWGDFQCPDTRTAWINVLRPLLTYINQNGLRATLTYRAFPLPYHYNSYIASRAATVAVELLVLNQKKTQEEAFVAVADQLLSSKQDSFQNAATATLTYDEVIEKVLWPILQGAGLQDTDKAGFLALTKATTTDANLRVSWKYACSRGVSGTPVYAADYVVSDAAASWDLAAWKAFLSARV